MTVKGLISILSKEVKPVDRNIAEIEIWCGEQEYEIKSMSGFSLSPNIIINIKSINSQIIKPIVVKKEHVGMIKKQINKINKE